MRGCNGFARGTLTAILDGQFGSSGKGKLGSYMFEKAPDYVTFACNAFWPQAGHWVVKDDGTKYFYQTLNSCSHNERLEDIFIGPGAIIELSALWREIRENKVVCGPLSSPSDHQKLWISPFASILLDSDGSYERGNTLFDSDIPGIHHGTMKSGSTAHGAGSCAARKVLRRPSVVLAKDAPDLKNYICPDVQRRILDKLKRGESGILEIAQGFPLSLHSNFYPHVTGRNCTVAQGLSDMFLPPSALGPVVINFRTFPIRINSNKYVSMDGLSHLTWDQVQSGVPYRTLEGDSGPVYPDQHEISWEEVTKLSGSPDPIFEITSVTKLPRRVFTFSKQNMREAIELNRSNGFRTYISINFANYVDIDVQKYGMTDALAEWLGENVDPVIGEFGHEVSLYGIGTGPYEHQIIRYGERHGSSINCP